MGQAAMALPWRPEQKMKIDELVKRRKATHCHSGAGRNPVFQTLLDPGLRRDDVERTFCEPIKIKVES
jgi:hypothetical protein